MAKAATEEWWLRPEYQPGQIIKSPGCLGYTYEIIGAVCRLYDREDLPYPSCSLAYKPTADNLAKRGGFRMGKQPSWRRIGRRFVEDMASAGRPVFSVRCLDPELQPYYLHHSHDLTDTRPVRKPRLLQPTWLVKKQ